ncbi:MAG TPA: ShlB/FhaC/HecB family hemolysin secretion/activation protein, partial [Verrucomicrobiae bacterium]|nr:ShlB/FhaC/HecB family hemolysin secretion/activation protein [Verrucomicrobiae bacterium]
NNLQQIMEKHTGTNTTLKEITSAASDLQLEYRTRGFPTVSVTIPQQRITNGIVTLRVIEGKLTDIVVKGNHYFSSNNVMRSLPGLRTNEILNGALFQAELDRANASQDRQIYPQIRPGPEPETSALTLDVKDRLPLHAKIEVNNQNSPGTPDLRLNSSMVYNNLWQLEHSIGIQYNFSPGRTKRDFNWNFYDVPLVANYSMFYRMPLGETPPIADLIAEQPGSFGYDEATRKFRLPPPSGLPELNFFASRSTIDTGVNLSPLTDLTATATNIPPNTATNTTNSVITLARQNSQQDITITEDLGVRVSEPLGIFDAIRSTLSFGFDFKNYRLASYGTNTIIVTQHFTNQNNGVPITQVFDVPSAVPPTRKTVQYVPLTLRWDGSRPDRLGRTDFSVGYTPNFSGAFLHNRRDFTNVATSVHSDGYYHILTASLGREQNLYKEWKLSLRADGQWANQPLISNEQFGNGGVAGVRGYQEGEVFGDTGWRVIFEPKSPPLLFGLFDNGIPMVARASIFMDYGETYLLDPNGRQGHVALWGTGFGAAMTIGSAWEARLQIAVPLSTTSTTPSGRVRFAFALSASF